LIALRRAGCVHVQYGVESGSTRILGLLNKDIRTTQIEEAARLTRRAGLVFSVYLISGLADETEADLAQTEDLLERIRPHDAMVSPLAVFPGTALWSEWRKTHALDDSYWGAGSREDVYVRAGDPSVSRGIARIGRAVERAAATAAYTLEDYRAQRLEVGECHAIDLAEADLHQSEGRAHEALRTLARLAEREPDNPWAHLRSAELQLDLRRPVDAARSLETLVRLVPRFAEGHALLGRALARAGRAAEARKCYAEALALDPGHAAASRALRRLGVVEASAHLAPGARRRAALVRN
jgi:tetratricopeptide (TPR) repeat protein